MNCFGDKTADEYRRVVTKISDRLLCSFPLSDCFGLHIILLGSVFKERLDNVKRERTNKGLLSRDLDKKLKIFTLIYSIQ